MLVGGMLMRTGAGIEIGIGKFTVYLMHQRAIGSAVNIFVHMGRVAVSFCCHGALNILVVREPLSSLGPWDQVMRRSS